MATFGNKSTEPVIGSPMSSSSRQDPRTAKPGNSIWRDTLEDEFRQHLVNLEERTNAVPVEPQVFSVAAWQSERGKIFKNHVLPLEMEHRLADDFAFLAAVEEGAQSVAAACVEEQPNGEGMTIRFAAMDAIHSKHQNALRGISRVLMDIAKSTNVKGGEHDSRPDLKGRILRLHRHRIIARLRSVKWPKPRYLSESHKKPLWKDFSNLIHRAQFLYTKREGRAKFAIQIRLQKLALLYEGFEELESDAALDIKYLSQIVEESYYLCTSDGMKAYVHKLESVRATAQVASAVKCVRQIEKIATYWRIPISLSRASEKYSSLFSSIDLQYLVPYVSIPTSTSYESWAKTCHVHAEVQLVVHYDLHQDHGRLRPRAIGTSKYMCFLCLLFIKAHGHFFPANTHGRLYDQWTIPDRVEYGPDHIERYRRVIFEMDDEVVKLSQPEPRWQPEPMTSRQDLSQLPGASLPWIGTGKPLKVIPFVPSADEVNESAAVLPLEQRTLR